MWPSLWKPRRPQWTRRQGRWPPGRCLFRDQWWIRGLGRPWRIRGLRGHQNLGPPKIFLGRWLPGGRSGSADARGRSGVDSVSSWTKADTPRLGTALLAVTRELDSLGLGTALLAVTRELDSPGRGDCIPRPWLEDWILWDWERHSWP